MGNTLRALGTSWKTHWEPMEHHWEHGWQHDENTRMKESPRPPPLLGQGRKMNPLGCMLNCLIGNMHIVFMTNVQHKIIHKRPS